VIYTDTNVLIRLLEGDAKTRSPIEARLQPLRSMGRFLLTSRLLRGHLNRRQLAKHSRSKSAADAAQNNNTTQASVAYSLA
jgi:predicted nucleic acid-binding protein